MKAKKEQIFIICLWDRRGMYVAKLNYSEKDAIKRFFNQSGHILDFFILSFDRFTFDSIGTP